MKNLLILFSCSFLVCACLCSGNSSKQKAAPQEESKSLPVSTITLKGKHATLFKAVGDSYTVNLVNTNDGWAIRAKITLANKTSYENIRENYKYERELTSIYGHLINSSDVELESLDIDNDDLDALILEDEDEEAVITCKTYGFNHFSYEDAKSLYDRTAGILISGIELKSASKEKSTKILDDEMTDAVNTVKDIVEVEGELLKALGGML